MVCWSLVLFFDFIGLLFERINEIGQERYLNFYLDK